MREEEEEEEMPEWQPFLERCFTWCNGFLPTITNAELSALEFLLEDVRRIFFDPHLLLQCSYSWHEAVYMSHTNNEEVGNT